MKDVMFTIVGTSPFLMHGTGGMKPKGSGPVRTVVPTPEVEAEQGVYRTEQGVLRWPTTAFRSALIDAGTGLKVGRQAAGKVFQGAVFALDEWSEFYDPESGAWLTTYERDMRRAVVQKQGILRTRARLPRWACPARLEVDEEVVPIEVVVEFLNKAGRYVGVGDFRPKGPGWSGGKGGPFGRFQVVKWEVQ